MGREPIPTWFFVLAAVRREDHYLLVHERKHGQLWYLPAGRVERGEDFVSAVRRETLEESGVPIEVDGIIRLEHSPSVQGARVRIILSAKPIDDTPPKSKPDEESLGAGWFTLDQMRRLPLRGSDVLDVCGYLQAGGKVAPLTMLTREGAPFT